MSEAQDKPESEWASTIRKAMGALDSGAWRVWWDPESCPEELRLASDSWRSYVTRESLAWDEEHHGDVWALGWMAALLDPKALSELIKDPAGYYRTVAEHARRWACKSPSVSPRKVVRGVEWQPQRHPPPNAEEEHAEDELAVGLRRLVDLLASHIGTATGGALQRRVEKAMSSRSMSWDLHGKKNTEVKRDNRATRAFILCVIYLGSKLNLDGLWGDGTEMRPEDQAWNETKKLLGEHVPSPDRMEPTLWHKVVDTVGDLCRLAYHNLPKLREAAEHLRAALQEYRRMTS